MGKWDYRIVHRRMTQPLMASYIPFFRLHPGSQTLGEEYVDVHPYAKRRRNFPTKRVSSRYSGWTDEPQRG
jgi:hypothetical protein